jgi:hypothetical protein
VTKAKVVLRAPQKPLPQTPLKALEVLEVLEVLCAGVLAPVALPWLLACSPTATRAPKRLEKTVLKQCAFMTINFLYGTKKFKNEFQFPNYDNKVVMQTLKLD